MAATGIPGGICTTESSESSGTFPPTGTPMTGCVVIEAITPGRAAESPAIPTKMRQPSSKAASTTPSRYFGARWALATRTSWLMPNSSSNALHLSATGRSDLLPRMMVTSIEPLDSPPVQMPAASGGRRSTTMP